MNDLYTKSKDNNRLIYLKKDIKDIVYFTYRKKGYYSIIYREGFNLNKTLVENLGYYVIKE